jgi:peptide/nickel transport system substrate-binding protein
LTAYNAKLEVVPALAVSWETPDATTYVWKLRQGVKFHNGQELSAEDVKYSIERMLMKETGNLWLFTFDSIDQVTAADKYTVRMTTKRPDPGLPAAFATNRGHAIMPAGAHQKTDLATKPIGTGPFKIVEYVSASHVTAERFADYWGKPMPYIDRLTFKILGDEEARVAGIRAKQIDGAQIAVESISRLQGDASIQILKSDVYSPYTLEPNAGKAPTNDVRVRRAISMALDRNAYIEKVVGGNGTLTGPIATGYSDWFIPPDQLGYKHDPEGAKKLLAEAGVAPGTVLTFPYQGDNPFYSAIAVITADQLKKVGLELKLEPVEAGVLTARGPSRNRDYHFFSRRRGFRHDPDAHLRSDFHSAGGSNPGYKSAELDDLLDKARGEMDRAKRKDMYTRIQKIILDENPHIFLFSTIKVDAVQGYVKGYEPQYTAFRETLRQTWLDK